MWKLRGNGQVSKLYKETIAQTNKPDGASGFFLH